MGVYKWVEIVKKQPIDYSNQLLIQNAFECMVAQRSLLDMEDTIFLRSKVYNNLVAPAFF